MSTHNFLAVPRSANSTGLAWRVVCEANGTRTTIAQFRTKTLAVAKAAQLNDRVSK